MAAPMIFCINLKNIIHLWCFNYLEADEICVKYFCDATDVVSCFQVFANHEYVCCTIG